MKKVGDPKSKIGAAVPSSLPNLRLIIMKLSYTIFLNSSKTFNHRRVERSGFLIKLLLIELRRINAKLRLRKGSSKEAFLLV